MPDNDLEAIQRLLQHPGLDPKRKEALQAAIAARSQSAQQGAPASASVPSPVMGAMAPVPDYASAREAEILKRSQAGKREELPTAYRPNGLGDDAGSMLEPSGHPILHYEDAEGDESWKRDMAKAAETGRSAYRVEKEFPLNSEGKPLGEVVGNYAVRAGLPIASALWGADSSLTGGLLTKGITRLGEKAGVLPEGLGQEIVQQQRKQFPVQGAAGAIGGALSPGGLAGRIGSGASKLFGVGQGSVPGQLMRLAGAGAVGAGAQTAAEGTVENQLGGNRDVPREAAGSAVVGAALGPLFGGLGMLGRRQQESLRDPTTATGRDLILAEVGGAKTSTLSGVKPGPAVAQVSDEARRLGVSPEQLVSERAVSPLGGSLKALRNETLETVGNQNRALYANAPEVNMEPVAKTALGAIRKATSVDGTALPGQKVTEAVNALKGAAELRVVDAKSDLAQGADTESMIPLSLAKKLGLVSGQPGSTDAGKVVLIQPRSTSLEKLEAARQQLDDRAGAVGEYDPAKRVAKELAGSVRQAREQLGPEVAATKAAQSKSLSEMKNTLEAAGLPRDSDVDLGDFGTRESLFKAVRRYRSDSNLVADRELDRLAARNPSLRQALDEVASTDAVQRLRGKSDVKIAINPSGQVKPYGATTAIRLRLDPFMGVLGSMGDNAPGLAPVSASELAKAYRGR